MLGLGGGGGLRLAAAGAAGSSASASSSTTRGRSRRGRRRHPARRRRRARRRRPRRRPSRRRLGGLGRGLRGGPSPRAPWRARSSSRPPSWRRGLRGRRRLGRPRLAVASRRGVLRGRVRGSWCSCLRSRFAFHRRTGCRSSPGRFRTLVRPLSSPRTAEEASQSRLTTGQIIYCLTLAVALPTCACRHV